MSRGIKKVGKSIWGEIVKSAVKSTAEFITELDGVKFDLIEGGTKRELAVAHLRREMKEAGKEIETSAAEHVVTGLLTGFRRGLLRLEDVGEDVDGAADS